MAATCKARTGIDTRSRIGSVWSCRIIMVVVEMGSQRIWSLLSDSLRCFLLIVVFPRRADCLFLILYQHAWDQPRNLHWRLRKAPVTACAGFRLSEHSMNTRWLAAELRSCPVRFPP